MVHTRSQTLGAESESSLTVLQTRHGIELTLTVTHTHTCVLQIQECHSYTHTLSLHLFYSHAPHVATQLHCFFFCLFFLNIPIASVFISVLLPMCLTAASG